MVQVGNRCGPVLWPTLLSPQDHKKAPLLSLNDMNSRLLQPHDDLIQLRPHSMFGEEALTAWIAQRQYILCFSWPRTWLWLEVIYTGSWRTRTNLTFLLRFSGLSFCCRTRHRSRGRGGGGGEMYSDEDSDGEFDELMSVVVETPLVLQWPGDWWQTVVSKILKFYSAFIHFILQLTSDNSWSLWLIRLIVDFSCDCESKKKSGGQ